MSKIFQDSITETYIYRLPRFLLNLFGIWPLNAARNSFYFYSTSIVLLTAVTASIAHGCINITHLHVALLSFCPAVFELVTWIKLMLFWYHSKKLANLLNTLLDLCNEGRINKKLSLAEGMSLMIFFFIFQIIITVSNQSVSMKNALKAHFDCVLDYFPAPFQLVRCLV